VLLNKEADRTHLHTLLKILSCCRCDVSSWTVLLERYTSKTWMHYLWELDCLP